MKRAWLGLLLALVFSLGWRTPASACSIAAWKFPDYLAASKAVVHGRAVDVSRGGAKAKLEVLAYVGPGTAPAFIDLPQTEQMGGGGVCPEMQLKFSQDGEYVVFLGDLPPNLRFADELRGALRVDEAGHVRDQHNQAASAESLLRQFASERGYPVQGPDSQAPRWASGTGMPAWALLAAGAVVLLGLVGLWRRLGGRHRPG